MVTQINKKHPPMIAAVINPPAQPNELPDIGATKLPAIMGTITVRLLNLFRADN
jgi:hypothetical protein